MTVLTAQATPSSSLRHNPLWRTVRLHAISPSVFFGVPWIILGGALAVSLVIGIIARTADPSVDLDGMRYSWAVLSPQWYLVVVGVQAVGLTFPLALGFGSTRRDFWLGSLVMFVLVSAEMAVAIATLVLIEQATGGWWLGIHMFDALWYGQNGWLVDFYTTFVLQLLVLLLGAAATTVYMRWRIRGMVVLTFIAVALALAVVATITFTRSWTQVFLWLTEIGMTGVFTLLLVVAAVCAAGGYLVIRRATTR